jgi:hypothetical protein
MLLMGQSYRAELNRLIAEQVGRGWRIAACIFSHFCAHTFFVVVIVTTHVKHSVNLLFKSSSMHCQLLELLSMYEYVYSPGYGPVHVLLGGLPKAQQLFILTEVVQSPPALCRGTWF